MLPVSPTRRTRSAARIARPLLASAVLVGSAALALPATAVTPVTAHVTAAAAPAATRAAAASRPATGGHVTTMTSLVSARALHLTWQTPTGASAAHVASPPRPRAAA